MNIQKLHKFTIQLSLIILSTLFSISDSSAQQVWQADSSIEDMTIERSGGYYILDVTIKSHNDDDARSPKLVINLARNCRVNAVKMPSGFESTAFQVFGNKTQAAKSADDYPQIDSYINFDLKNLPNKPDLYTFRVSFLATNLGLRPSSEVSALIYSITPEANKKNNFMVKAIN